MSGMIMQGLLGMLGLNLVLAIVNFSLLVKCAHRQKALAKGLTIMARALVDIKKHQLDRVKELSGE